MTRRLGVVGTLVLDTIRGPVGAEGAEGEAPGRRADRSSGGEPFRGLGGIAYSLSAFEAEPPPGWSLYPILKVGADAREVADRYLERLESVASLEGVETVPEPNNRVELSYRGDGERTERLRGGVPGWTWGELEPLARACDALYVNLVAGWEIDLGCARRLAETCPRPLYCDLHSLLLERGPDGTRRPRVPDGWREWMGCFDYVQVNERELAILAREEGKEPWTLAEELVGERPRALFVTLGPEGAAWVSGAGRRSREEAGGGAGGAIPEGRLPVPEVVRDGDPTGCGDVWGITCFGSLLGGADPAEAVARANRLAARNAGLRGGDALLRAARAGDGPRDGGRARPPGGGGEA